jgi:hypothetical protein
MMRRRGAAEVLGSACAVLICAIVGQATGQQREQRSVLAPTFVWSPESYISAGPAGTTSRVSYQVAEAISQALYCLAATR